MTDNWDEALVEYFEGDMSPAQRADFVASLDETQLAELTALRRSTEQLANLPDVPVPHGFAAQIVSRIAPRRPGLRRRMLMWLEKHPLLGWEAGALSLTALLVVVLVGGNPLTVPATIQHSATPVAGVQTVGLEQARHARFRLYAPQATTVALIGDFNGWGSVQEIPLRRQIDGNWVADLPLPAGRYQYAFLIDDQTIVTDPRAEQHVSDDFGRRNAVVTVL